MYLLINVLNLVYDQEALDINPKGAFPKKIMDPNLISTAPVPEFC